MTHQSLHTSSLHYRSFSFGTTGSVIGQRERAPCPHLTVESHYQVQEEVVQWGNNEFPRSHYN